MRTLVGGLTKLKEFALVNDKGQQPAISTNTNSALARVGSKTKNVEFVFVSANDKEQPKT